MAIATHWPDIDVFAPSQIRNIRYFDKIVHMSLYLGWALLWVWVLSAKGRRVRGTALAMVFAGGALWAMLDEASQGLVRRSPDVWDWLCDLTGLGLGVLIVVVHQRRSGRAKDTGAVGGEGAERCPD